MYSIHAAADPDSRIGPALVALVPATAGAAVEYCLKTVEAPEFSQVASAAAVILVGVPFARQAVRRDEQRAMRSAESRAPSSTSPTASFPNIVVHPSTTTVALAAVLGAAAFWLLDLLTSMLGYGSLGFFGGQLSDDRGEVYRALTVRAIPLLLVGTFLIAVWMGHRLRDRATVALNTAVVLFVAAVLGTNLLFAELSDPPGLGAEDIYIPLLEGVLAYVVCSLGNRYAAHTQDRFDLMRAARLQSDLTTGTRR
jgi:hypothetical protein